MSELTLSQAERRSFLVPGVIAFAILGTVFAALAIFTPHRVAAVTVTHTAILPTHTVFKSESIVVADDPSQDDLYVLATVRIEDQLKLPIFIKNLTGTLETADGSEGTENAVEKGDLENLYTTFPKLRPLATTPLLRETAIQPGQSAEGMVLLHFPVTQAAWESRKSATISISFYHQGPITVTIPKP